MKVQLLEYPAEKDWVECKRRALVTVRGWSMKTPSEPTSEWKSRILQARHSPIRRLWFSFWIEGIPSNASVHLCRHVHAQPYVGSLRNDRQDEMDGDEAPRNTPVDMILDVNAEELMVLANKRLCAQASDVTREAVKEMCRCATKVVPELEPFLVPMCVWNGGYCHEMKPCGMYPKWEPVEEE